MTITAPWRRMILHRSQRGLIDVRIFIGKTFLSALDAGHVKTAARRRQTC
jgi:hypothetical protein